MLHTPGSWQSSQSSHQKCNALWKIADSTCWRARPRGCRADAAASAGDAASCAAAQPGRCLEHACAKQQDMDLDSPEMPLNKDGKRASLLRSNQQTSTHRSRADLGAAGCRHSQPRQAMATAAWRTEASRAVGLVAAPADRSAAVAVGRTLRQPPHRLVRLVTRPQPGRPAPLRRRSGHATSMQRAAPDPPACHQVTRHLTGLDKVSDANYQNGIKPTALYAYGQKAPVSQPAAGASPQCAWWCPRLQCG